MAHSMLSAQAKTAFSLDHDGHFLNESIPIPPTPSTPNPKKVLLANYYQ